MKRISRETVSRICALLLSIALTVAVFTSCGSSNSYITETTESIIRETESIQNAEGEKGSEELIIAQDGKSDFSIRISHYFYVMYPKIKESAATIAEYIKNSTGATVTVYDDAQFDSSKNDEPSILIGRTLHPASSKPSPMKIDEWHIGGSDNKIVICADFEEGALAALKHFLFYVITPQTKDGSKTIVFNDTYAKTNKCNYGIDSILCLGKELSEYRIVIAKTATMRERLIAYSLREHLISKYGYPLMVVTDSMPKEEHEILVGNTKRTNVSPEKDSFLICAEGKTLSICADGMLGYEGLMKYLCEELFKPGEAESYVIGEGASYVGSLETKLENGTYFATNRDGDVRFMTYNVYCGKESGAIENRQELQEEIIKAYSPDVLAVQEFNRKYDPTFTSFLSGLGYAKAGEGSTVLFYKSDSLKLEVSDTLVYSQGNDSSKAVTWALLKTGSGKRFIAMLTHLAWNDPELDDPAAIRLSQAGELISLTNSLISRYGVPVILGGDFNCRLDTEPLLLLTSLSVAQKEAQTKNDNGGHHSYAQLDEAKNIYSTPVPTRSYDKSIDHIFVTGDITVKTFGTLFNDYCVWASDHSPMLTEISFQ